MYYRTLLTKLVTHILEPCKLRPIKHGSCPATSLQWYYNTKTRACLEIGPNECTNKLNGFETSADCEKKCIARGMIYLF